MLEIGNAALVFTRDGAAGKLALVLGDQAPVDLPVSFPLDAEGRSGEPLTINFTREGSVVTVEAGGQKMAFAADQFPGQRLEVVASAGAENSWAFARLEVALPVAEVMAPASGAGSRGSDATNATPSALDRKSDAAKSKPTTSRTGTVAGPDPTGAPATPAATAGKAGVSSLEIFTPPSVRHGRADTVRNTVATGLQK